MLRYLTVLSTSQFLQSKVPLHQVSSHVVNYLNAELGTHNCFPRVFGAWALEFKFFLNTEIFIWKTFLLRQRTLAKQKSETLIIFSFFCTPLKWELLVLSWAKENYSFFYFLFIISFICGNAAHRSELYKERERGLVGSSDVTAGTKFKALLRVKRHKTDFGFRGVWAASKWN